MNLQNPNNENKLPSRDFANSPNRYVQFYKCAAKNYGKIKVSTIQKKIELTSEGLTFKNDNRVECNDFEKLFINDKYEFDNQLRKKINLYILYYSKSRNLEYRKIEKDRIQKIFKNVKTNFPTKNLLNEIDLLAKIILNEK